MLPNSFSFLAFFAVVTVAYYLLPHRFRWPLLLLASLYFYSTFEPVYLVLLGLVTVVTWGAGVAIEKAEEGRRKSLMAGSVLLVISALLVFKYYNLFAGSAEAALGSGWFGDSSIFPRFPRLDLVLFVGLSFYSFSCVSYLVDVYRRQIPAERHFGYFALYVAFFPKLLAGPIERAGPFLEQVKACIPFDPALFSLGLQLLLWGLVKKVLIADRLAIFVDAAYGQPMFASPADLLIATYFFAFQLYCDFSGYSDMAIGMSMVLGIRLMENFRRPYLARSTAEFWSRRWHLSLASWFRDYMFIPLGGSRVSRLRVYLNLMAVFMVSGLWHGANWTFVVWGALNGIYNVVSVATRKVRDRLAASARIPELIAAPFSILVTFHLILITWVYFRASSITDANLVIRRVLEPGSALPGMVVTRIQAGGILFPAALIVGLMVVEVIDERRPMWERVRTRPVVVRWGLYYAMILALLLFGTWQMNNFVYMQF